MAWSSRCGASSCSTAPFEQAPQDRCPSLDPRRDPTSPSDSRSATKRAVPLMDDTPSPTLAAHSDLLRPAEAAALLGVRTSTIARWAREGLWAATATPGGHRRYRRDEILAAGDGSTPEPPAELTQMEAD